MYSKYDSFKWPSLAVCCVILFYFVILNSKVSFKRDHCKYYQLRKYKHFNSCISPKDPTTHPNDRRNQNNHILGGIDSSSRNICNNVNSNNCEKKLTALLLKLQQPTTTGASTYITTTMTTKT